MVRQVERASGESGLVTEQQGCQSFSEVLYYQKAFEWNLVQLVKNVDHFLRGLGLCLSAVEVFAQQVLLAVGCHWPGLSQILIQNINLLYSGTYHKLPHLMSGLGSRLWEVSLIAI